MNDTAIKNYAIWARKELITEVQKRCALFGIAEGADTNASVVDGRVLSATERMQRSELLRMMKADGYEQLVEKAAYTWFNRLLAIRFMEINDRLPGHVRMLSATDGTFKPQALAEAMDLTLEALDTQRAAQLVQSGDDEALFRLVFLAQCDELAQCMPAVFEPVGSAMELLLPDGLLRQGGVVEQLVTTIPEESWTEGVEIVGWMYQYYVSEKKDEVFASFKKGKKAERESIAPATQLFTPNWIVRYLTENSLGRLWMLNHPESKLPEQMPYFIKPDEDAETEFKKVSSPEEITVADPACGSGHILVYAFDLLAAMYAEAGYSNRDAARLILEKNLSGLEIDPRAAAMASFCLTMKACELDSRFLRRNVSPRITVLSRVEFEPEEKSLLRLTYKDLNLLDAAAHLDECGSLFKPTADELSHIERDLASLAAEGSLFADSAAEKLQQLQAELLPLATRYDVVVANPPYMGAKNMNKWLGDWVKENYADYKGDLFSCFMVRNCQLGAKHAQLGFMTPYVWMFISTYEKLRHFIIGQNTITSLIQLEYSGFAGATVPICTFTLQNSFQEDYKGGYIRLSDFVGADQQSPRALEALANPDCGWFFRRSADAFSAIPGNPIAYWVSEGMISAFKMRPLDERLTTREGMATANNDLFLRFWHEVSIRRIGFNCSNSKTALESAKKWFPYQKGGEYRKWYGNNDYVVNWENDGESIRNNVDPDTGRIRSHNYNGEFAFRESATWSALSSASIHVRYSPKGTLFDSKGAKGFANNFEEVVYSIALINSSTSKEFLKFLAPTLDFKVGDIAKLPDPGKRIGEIVTIANSCIDECVDDYNAFEESWDFERHPLI